MPLNNSNSTNHFLSYMFMKKQFLLMLILCLSATMVWAERIEISTARKVAESVAQREGVGGDLRSTEALSLIYAAAPGQDGRALRSGTMSGAADYFVFNFTDGKGFAIVAGDDRVRPVLGYSSEGSFDPDNLPENLRGMLAYYQDQISWANDKGIEATPDIAAEWSRHISGTALRAAGQPVLIETANWGQSEPYNRQTPQINGENAVTGCVATAMGIIMNYHKYPTQAVNPPEYNYYSIDGRNQEVKLTYDDYDWDNILDSYIGEYNDVQANAVAKLLYHCGANVRMDYSIEESGTQTILVASALSDVFGYSPSIRYLQKDEYSWDEWKAMLREELDAGYPVIYDGTNMDDEGHAFVCDGYTPDGLFHINWGWDGDSNGFFELSILGESEDGSGFSEEQGMLLNIRPELTGDRYFNRPALIEAHYSKTGNTASVSFGFEYFALYDHEFHIELGVVDDNNQIINKPTSSGPISLTGMGDDGECEYYTDYTRTLSSPLSEGQRIALLCSADGVNWEVMRGKKDVPLGINDNGEIKPSENIPDEPEPEPTPTTYKVTLPVVEGATISASGSTTVTEGGSFSFTIEVQKGYDATNMVVKANDTTLTADSNGTYEVTNISDNVVVTVTGIVKSDDPTSNDEIDSAELRVWSAGSRLFIHTPEAAIAYIVALDGRVYKTLSLSVGEYVERMPQGVYIIQIDGKSFKLNF